MRYEGKSVEDAVAAAASALGRPPGEIQYRVVRDEKSFWGGRVVEIEARRAAKNGDSRGRIQDARGRRRDRFRPGTGARAAPGRREAAAAGRQPGAPRRER